MTFAHQDSFFFSCMRQLATTTFRLAAFGTIFIGCGPTYKQMGLQQTSVSSAPPGASLATQKDEAVTKDRVQKDSVLFPPAAQLLVRACNNYLEVNPDNDKTAEVLTIKGSLFFNYKLFDSARAVFGDIINKFPSTLYGFDAIRITAQTFYEEKRFDEAGAWYKKLSDATPEGGDKTEALARIAESIFRMAETMEARNRFKEAAEQYERVAMEYPDAKIADLALFNAGLAWEKQNNWSHAMLAFRKLMTKYDQSKLLAKAEFRIAKCHEKLQQWDLAADTYLRLAIKYPRDELAPSALYNAAFCFETGNKPAEAAAAFEKTARLYPQSDDAADVLFRAGELYGKIKDWESVSRVTQIFSSRFGNDEERIIQALCMDGVALYMRNRNDEAINRLENAIATYGKMKNPGPMNSFYAAKAQYTIAEIRHNAMNTIVLGRPRERYNKQLSEKSDLLDDAVKAYTRVIKIGIMEWTTRSLFQIGQAYEDFATGIFSQDRPSGLSIDSRIAFELGIAEAVEKFFIEKALYYHERNVKLGIAEKIEDRFILQSRGKLTLLPGIAAENYLALAEIARTSRVTDHLDGFALIAGKLQVFQKIAPFQEKAIMLFLKCLEMGTTYQEFNDYYKQASTTITAISFSVGETYADVVSIARDAPIPDGFDDYERFVYKIKLLKQVEAYEKQAIDNYLKTIRIAESYKVSGKNVKDSEERIGRILFNQGRCYDLLCSNAFFYPPFPRNIGVTEQEEYKARFEELGLKFQEKAFDIYKSLIDLAEKSYASGEYVTHAYVRLYQNNPEQYGIRERLSDTATIFCDSLWRASNEAFDGWFSPEFNDSLWSAATTAQSITGSSAIFSGEPMSPMWLDTKSIGDKNEPGLETAHFRRTFTVDNVPEKATLRIAAHGVTDLYLNGKHIATDSLVSHVPASITHDLTGKIRSGRNTLAVRVTQNRNLIKALFLRLRLQTEKSVILPKPPGFDKPLTPDEVRIDAYQFPVIKNFTLEQKEPKP